MANTIKLKRGTTTPTAAVLSSGELAVNTATGQVYTKNDAGTVVQVGITPPVTSVAGRTGAVTLAVADVSGAAPLASPALTGVPTAPTPSSTDNSTTIATTAYVTSAVAGATVGATSSVVATVRNQTGATVTAGSVVYLNGSSGNKPLIALAQANSQATSMGTYGLIQSDISTNNNGTCVVAGLISNINTSAYTAGTILYLSATTAGGLTSTMPTAPNHSVQIGIVTYQHANQGTIQLTIQNGFEISELHDVQLTSPANNDLLYYNSSTSLWNNGSFSTLGLAPLASPTFTGTVTIPAGASISGYATTSSLSSYAPLASPALTGTPTAPTAATATNTTQIATTAFVKAQGYAPLTSPAFTGTPTSTTPATADNSTNIATTAYVQAQGYAPLASPTFTGTPNSVTGTTNTGGTQIATQAFVRNSVQQGITSYTATVVSNTLQITLNGGQAFFFRPATLNSATNTVYTTTSMGLIVPSGATLGTINNVQAQLVLVLVYNAGSPQVGIVNIAGGFNLDETTLISTTAISASATANNVVYTTSAITGSPFRVLGYITITEATAGTWATAPTLTQGAGGEAAVGYQTVGMGQTYQNKTSSRAAATTYYNTTPKPIYLSIFFNHGVSNGAGTSQINVNGVQVTSNLNPSGRYNFTSTAIVPPGVSYSVTLTGDASINTWFELS